MANFITVQDLTDFLGRDVTTDPGAQAAVSSACAVCRAITEQTFDLNTSTISFDGTDTDALLLPQLPVTNVASVLVNGAAITDFSVTEFGVLLRGTAGADPRPTWPVGRQNVTVTYSHGYPDFQVPEEVCQVALDFAARRIVQGVASSESVGGHVSITYAQGIAGNLTENEKRILQRFRTTRSFQVPASFTTFLRGRNPFQLRGLFWLGLGEMASVQYPTKTTDDGGGATTVWTTRESVICRIDPMGPSTGILGGRISERSTHTVSVPTTTNILATDRFVIGGRGTFEVTASHMQTYEGPVSHYEVVQTP